MLEAAEAEQAEYGQPGVWEQFGLTAAGRGLDAIFGRTPPTVIQAPARIPWVPILLGGVALLAVVMVMRKRGKRGRG